MKTPCRRVEWGRCSPSALNGSEAKRLRFGRSRLSNEMPVKHHWDILCAYRSTFLNETPKHVVIENLILFLHFISKYYSTSLLDASYRRRDNVLIYFTDMSVSYPSPCPTSRPWSCCPCPPWSSSPFRPPPFRPAWPPRPISASRSPVNNRILQLGDTVTIGYCDYARARLAPRHQIEAICNRHGMVSALSAHLRGHLAQNDILIL